MHISIKSTPPLLITVEDNRLPKAERHGSLSIFAVAFTFTRNFVQEMDAELQILSNNQGENGMPASPDAGRRANPEGQAQPYLTAILDLQQQQQEADQTERDVQRAIASSTQGHD
jgi:hypothetical protein